MPAAPVATIGLCPPPLNRSPGLKWARMLSSVSTTIWSGSSISAPALPRGADRSSAAGAMVRPLRPEISTKPPSPPSGPPRAESAPRTVVCSAELIRMVPPSPAPVASVRTTAPCLTTVRAARRLGWPGLLAASTPSAIRPPPAPPEVSMVARLPTTTRPVATTSTVPPRWPAPPVASIVPPTRTPPPSARSVTVPVRPSAVGALIRPVLRTRSSTRPLAACAESSTLPPGASMVPLLVTMAVRPPGAVCTDFVTSIASSPSPARSRR